MFRRMILGLMVLPAMATVAVVGSPALRTKVYQQWAALGAWTEEARRADPVGFAQYANTKLRHDIQAMQRTRRELAAEVGQLSRKIREQQSLAEQARQMAEEFRAKYQLSSTNGLFPIEVRGAAYTQPQVKSQVRMLLAETEGYHQSVRELKLVQQEAESQLESLAVRINTTEAQLVALSAKRELLHARQLTAEGAQLLAQVDELMIGNARLIEGNPVRTVRELVATPSRNRGKPASNREVEAFLAQKVELDHPPAADVDHSDAHIDQVVMHRSLSKPEKPSPKKQKRSKPIFQQF